MVLSQTLCGLLNACWHHGLVKVTPLSIMFRMHRRKAHCEPLSNKQNMSTEP